MLPTKRFFPELYRALYQASKETQFFFPFWKKSRRLSRIYDEESNPDNFFFSNHLSSRLSTRLALNFNQISNGGLTQVNVGMNFPTLNTEIDYSFKEVSFPCRPKDNLLTLYPKKQWWDSYILGTMKNVEKGEDT